MLAASAWATGPALANSDAATDVTAMTDTQAPRFRPQSGPWIEPGHQQGQEVLPGIMVLTGQDLKPYQTQFKIPELADPYATQLQDSVVISGTAQYFLKFKSHEEIRRGGPYQIIWNDYYYADGTPMEGERFYAHSWDMKPVLWAATPSAEKADDGDALALSRTPATGPGTATANTEAPTRPRLWDPARDKDPPLQVWYGGHMRPQPGRKTAQWPEDNYSRDVFAFIEKQPGKWFSLENSIFALHGTWPRARGNFLGHRYGHQIIMIPKLDPETGERREVASVFYEEVTEVRKDGFPAVTQIFMDEMITPYHAQGKPVALIDFIHPKTKKPYPSAIREGGATLVEGPLYFRFRFKGEEWEAIGFSAGSFYGNYPASFASRKVTDGLKGKPYRLDLKDDGSDLHDAGAELGKLLKLAGGPARPAVMVAPDGRAKLGPKGELQVLVHAYRRDILPDHDYAQHPVKYRFDQMFRVMIYAHLQVSQGPRGALRFDIKVPKGHEPTWKPHPNTRVIPTLISSRPGANPKFAS